MSKPKTPRKTPADSERRDVSINIRIQRQQKDLIDRAVKALGKKRSDFMLEAACREAENVLLDRCYFSLSSRDYNRFVAALNRPPKNLDQIRKTLTTPPPWKE